jgi:hypothetical protein
MSMFSFVCKVYVFFLPLAAQRAALVSLCPWCCLLRAPSPLSSSLWATGEGEPLEGWQGEGKWRITNGTSFSVVYLCSLVTLLLEKTDNV